tara:strand:- start:2764 stop:2955 length:192 start_codon:yes stop_codon:yes gene_type:complete
MSSVKKKLSMKKYREENYSSVTNPRIKNKELKTCTLCPAKYYSNSKFDRFCDPCRKRASRMYA